MMMQLGEYLDDPWNYLDITHISIGYFNVYRQLYRADKQDLTSKMVITACLLTCLLKMFFFLRIYKTLTYIVTMML